jgi:hypothetical protein
LRTSYRFPPLIVIRLFSELPLIATFDQVEFSNDPVEQICSNDTVVWLSTAQAVLYAIGFGVLGVKLRRARDGFWLLKEFKFLGKPNMQNEN